MAQAEALEEVLGRDALDHVVYIQLDDDEIVVRLRKRGRPDDLDDVIRHRLEVYRSETEPLVAYYGARGLLRPVDGQGSVDEVHERVLGAIGVRAS